MHDDVDSLSASPTMRVTVSVPYLLSSASIMVSYGSFVYREKLCTLSGTLDGLDVSITERVIRVNL